MTIRYTNHLFFRLRTRRISKEVVEEIYLRAERRYFDTETKLFVAVRRVRLFGKLRLAMVAYHKENSIAALVTIHPLKANQLKNRVRSGRRGLICD